MSGIEEPAAHPHGNHARRIAVRPNVRAMQGYVPGEQLNVPGIIKLNTNENPYPPSPRVFEALREALTADRLRKYPSPLGDEFRRVAGLVLGVDPDSILIGNGSDDILTIVTRAFVPEGGLVASPTPSYVLYRTLAEIQGARFTTVPFDAEWQPPLPSGSAGGWPPDAHLSFLPNPNSPTGTLTRLERVAQLAARLAPAPLVLDEAYADFAPANGLKLLRDHPNLIVTRSLSKSYSLAGVRFGFGVAHPEVVRQLIKVKDSYNCDALSLVAATAALKDQDHFRLNRDKIIATRERMTPALVRLGFDVTPSHANFVWCRRSDRPVKPVYEALKQRGILVRYMSYDGTDGLRISVGTDEEVDRLLDELRAIL